MDFHAVGQLLLNDTFTIFGTWGYRIDVLLHPVNAFAQPTHDFIAKRIKEGVNNVIDGLSCNYTSFQ